MARYTLNVNGNRERIEADPDMPLLWVLRDRLGLVGTKFGCGIAQCGSCTVHLGGTPVRSCVTRVADVRRQKITTIEGLGKNMALNALQQAWIDHDVAQCGYCQAGQLMSATALLVDNPSPSDADINAAMAGNYCRCGTYQRIRAAIHSAARKTAAVQIYDPADREVTA